MQTIEQPFSANQPSPEQPRIFTAALHPDGSINHVNNALLAYVGLNAAEDVRGSDWFELIAPESEREQFRNAFRALVSRRPNAPRTLTSKVIREDRCEVPVTWCQIAIDKQDEGTAAALIGWQVDKHSEEQSEDFIKAKARALADTLAMRDIETGEHAARVVGYSLRLGKELGFKDDCLRQLELGALLHDVGKIEIPDSILNKPAALTDAEWIVMRKHAALGGRLIRAFEFSSEVARVAHEHHERWDGSGYPRRLKGNAICMGARIFAVADTLDAIMSDRVYRIGRNYETAREEIGKWSGRQFDPTIVEAFMAIEESEWMPASI